MLFFYFRQNTELNNMRSECSNLMKDLAETKNKLQQEELQRKSLEVSYKQSVSQLEVRVIAYTLCFFSCDCKSASFFFFVLYLSLKILYMYCPSGPVTGR